MFDVIVNGTFRGVILAIDKEAAHKAAQARFHHARIIVRRAKRTNSIAFKMAPTAEQLRFRQRVHFDS